MTVQVFPVVGPTTVCGAYGPRGSGFHYGIDLCAPTGTPILAVDDGTVNFGTDVQGGNVAVLHATDGRAWYFAHMLEVQSGSRAVRAGDQIGQVDTTGNAAAVGISHLHIELWPSGAFQRPAPDPTSELMAAQKRTAPLPPLPAPSQASAPASASGNAWLAATAILAVSVAAAWVAHQARTSRRARLV